MKIKVQWVDLDSVSKIYIISEITDRVIGCLTNVQNSNAHQVFVNVLEVEREISLELFDFHSIIWVDSYSRKKAEPVKHLSLHIDLSIESGQTFLSGGTLMWQTLRHLSGKE